MRKWTWLAGLVACAACAPPSGEGSSLPPAPGGVAVAARHADYGTASLVAGGPEIVLTTRERAFDLTVAHVQAHRHLWGIRDARAELTLARSRTDELGMHHVRMRQTVRGVPVWLGEMLAHYDATGRLVEISAVWAPGVHDVDTTPALSLEEAVARAAAAMRGDRPELEGDELAVERPELVVFAPAGRAPALAWHVALRALGDHTALVRALVDAKTGDVLDRFDDIQTIAATATGATGKSRTIEVSQSGATYQMIDAGRKVTTYTLTNQQITGNGTLVTSNTLTSWDQAATLGKGAAVDAHYHAEQIFDFYKKTFNRNAIDGKGAAIVSRVHYGQGVDNAFWDGTRMSYGDGSTRLKNLAAALDVAAHEFTHGVTTNESGLVYQNESGALNESISDVMGAVIEHGLLPNDTNNMVLGEGSAVGQPYLRSMVNPTSGSPPQPAHMTKLVKTTQDNGGVHINSGIPNNAFALMTIGGTNSVSKISMPKGIGWDASAKVWYRMNTDLLTTGSNFAAAAAASARAAKDLGLTQTEQDIVECAWIAVGVVPGTCKASATTAPASTPPPASSSSSGGSSGAASGGGGEASPTEPGGNPDQGVAPPAQTSDGGGCSSSPRAPLDLAPLALVGLGALVARRRRR